MSSQPESLQSPIELIETESAAYNTTLKKVGIRDLSDRGRICLLGEDRTRFLHGQVTNDVSGLKPMSGCYAALVSHKGKMESDLNIVALENEILLDFESGLSAQIEERLNHFIIADDVEVVDVAPHYGLVNVMGPAAFDVLRGWKSELARLEEPYQTIKIGDPDSGEFYVVRNDRVGVEGYDVYIPIAQMEGTLRVLEVSVEKAEGVTVPERVMEAIRIEHGIPRFGIDMDGSNLAPEAGIESRAISYAKGCYIGQEVIARIRTYGQVAKSLRGLRIEGEQAPAVGAELWNGEKRVGYLTSVLKSPDLGDWIALGYVRRECNEVGQRLEVSIGEGRGGVEIVQLPFVKKA